MPSLTLAAVGDMSFAGAVGELVKQRPPAFMFEHVAELLASADLRFGNLESVMLPPDFPARHVSPRALCGVDHAVEALRPIGFHVLNQATNHALDCGSLGLAHTYRRLVEIGAQPLGAGPTAEEAHAFRVVKAKGMRVGFLGWQEPCNWTLEGGGGRIAYFDLPSAVEEVRRRSAEVDVLVASLHADLEFRDGPSVLKVQWCRALADAGATIVLCHHPHVPQGIERRGNALIAYSLGNFIFRISEYLKAGSPHTDKAQVLMMTVEPGRVIDYRREHFRISHTDHRPEPCGFLARRGDARHSDRLDALVADEARLRSAWQESCLHYLRIHWDDIVKAGPAGFIDTHAWRLMGLSEHQHWLAGLREMAMAAYARNKDGDFTHCRPNAPFEGRK